ncbi:MAG: ABC transporter permease, partial [Anaerovoracaceae bacterium]
MMSEKKPVIAISILGIILLCSVFAGIVAPYEMNQMNVEVMNQPPSLQHLFGTDSLGRDLFSLIWYGGRVSLYIGLLAGTISTVIAVIYGCASGLGGERVDDLMMRFVELLLSIPSIL